MIVIAASLLFQMKATIILPVGYGKICFLFSCMVNVFLSFFQSGILSLCFLPEYETNSVTTGIEAVFLSGFDNGSILRDGFYLSIILTLSGLRKVGSGEYQKAGGDGCPPDSEDYRRKIIQCGVIFIS